MVLHLLAVLSELQSLVDSLKGANSDTILLLLLTGAVLFLGLLIFSFVLAFRLGSRMGKRSKEKEFEAKLETSSKEFDSKLRETMSEITVFKKALSEFFDNKAGDIYKENEDLKHKLEIMEKNLKRFQEKVGSSLGIMGIGSGSKKAQLLADLMLENQLLEERLYQVNQQMKEERDKMLDRELQNISYKKVMFSKFLESEEAREQFKRFLQDEKNLQGIKSVQELPGKTES